MSDSVPKVFMSYSWSSVDRVVDLAERLVNDGVDVVLDKWELKEGQDKYAFMERCVTDETITKVLMICDKSYAEKADNREGGVGNETMVISPEVYAKATQTKFVPIVFERNEHGQEYKPAYLKARIHIDLSNDDVYEKNYESLLRNLHDKPEYSKPPLGKMPEYLNEDAVSLSTVRAAVRGIQSYDGKNPTKLKHYIKNFNDEFLCKLNEYAPTHDANFNDNLLRQIDASKPLRDLFFDYAESIIIEGLKVGDIIGDFFEQVYNGVYCYSESSHTCRDSDFEFGLFLIWEMFVGTTAYLLHYECYEELRTMLNRTYFLNDSPLSRNPIPQTFVVFRTPFRYIEDVIKRDKGLKNYTLAGEVATKREKLPILSKHALANADIVLYQLSVVFDVKKHKEWAWFPTCYIYLSNGFSSGQQQVWSKMVSKRHCESLYPLFDVTTTEELIEAVKLNVPDSSFSYKSGASPAPSISYSIRYENIATLP